MRMSVMPRARRAVVSLWVLVSALLCGPVLAQGVLSANAPGWAAPTGIAPSTVVPNGVLPAWPNEGWSARTPMPAGRWAHASVSHSTGSYPDNASFLYLISGYDASFASTNRLTRYDVNAGTWLDLAPVPLPVGQVSAARVGNRIYLPGGYQASFSPTSTLQIYDIDTDTWSTGAPLPQQVGDFAIGVHQDRYIYVVGGYTGSADTNVVQVYDTTTNTWTMATAKPGTAVAGLRGGLAAGTLVVTGGYSQTAAATQSATWVGVVDAVDPNLITWTAGPDYPAGPAGRLAAGVPVAAGPAIGTPATEVVLFTGGDPNGQGLLVMADSWLFEVATGSWHSLPAKPRAVSNINDFVGIASGGKLHMVSTGGYDGTAVVDAHEWLTLGEEAFADVALTVDDGGVTVSPGGAVAYTLAYASNGPGFASAAELTATIPAGAEFNAGASTAGWTCTPDAAAGSACTLALGGLAAGAAGSATLALDALSPVPAGVSQLTLQAAIATATGEEVVDNNTASDITPFTAGAVTAVPVAGTQTAEDGNSVQVSVSLSEEPLESLTVSFASSNTGEGTVSPAALVFDAGNWNVPQSVTVTGVDDLLDDGDVAYLLGATLAGGGANYAGATVADVALVNLDDDHVLTVLSTGAGSVAASPQQATYETGAQVTLTATGDAGWTFAGWSGAAGGSGNPLVLTVNGNATITATFTQDQYPLTISTVGSGSVSADPAAGGYTLGQQVSLTASPAAGWSFAGWAGDASGTANPLLLTMVGPTAVTATFVQVPVQLSLQAQGSGSIQVSPQQAGYVVGDTITLTAVADSGWQFRGWQGALQGSPNPVTLTLSGDLEVVAVFGLAALPAPATIPATDDWSRLLLLLGIAVFGAVLLRTRR